MDAGDQLASEIITAIKAARDAWVLITTFRDPAIWKTPEGCRRKGVACSDPDDLGFLTSIIDGLEKSAP
jgi:hypothetical protein